MAVKSLQVSFDENALKMIRLSTHMCGFDKEVGLNADDKVCDKIKKN